MFSQENPCENVICKLMAILNQPQFVTEVSCWMAELIEIMMEILCIFDSWWVLLIWLAFISCMYLIHLSDICCVMIWVWLAILLEICLASICGPISHQANIVVISESVTKQIWFCQEQRNLWVANLLTSIKHSWLYGCNTVYMACNRLLWHSIHSWSSAWWLLMSWCL